MGNKKTELSYPFAETLPQPAKLVKMAAGIYWLRMPLPFALDHINLWLLEDEIDGKKGWTLVDTGVARPEVKELWEQIFAEELNGLPILRVIVTHMHPDHVGLAGWICSRWEAPLSISLSDYMFANLWTHPARNVDTSSASGGVSAANHFARHGLLDEPSLEQIRQRSSYYPNLVEVPPQKYKRLMDKDIILIDGKRWECIVGYGHAPEHMALYCHDENVLISGDMVLPTISTNVSVFDHEPEADPLRLYLQSLTRYFDLPADTVVLPSHGRPFVGLHERIVQLQEHHKDRLADTIEACEKEGGCSAAELIPILFKRKLDLHQMTFAMGEAIAHLHMLYFENKLQRHVDEQGVYKFSVIDEG